MTKNMKNNFNAKGKINLMNSFFFEFYIGLQNVRETKKHVYYKILKVGEREDIFLINSVTSYDYI